MIYLLPLFIFLSIADECDNCFQVQDLIKISVEKSSELQAREAEVEGLRYRAKNIGIWDNPKVFYSLGSRTEIEQSRSRVSEFGIEQSLPIWGQKSAARKAAMSEFQASSYNKMNTQQKIIFDVSRLSFDAATSIEERDYMNDRHRRLELIREYLKSRTFKAPSKIAEAILLRNRLTTIESEAERVELQLGETLEELNVYTKLPRPPRPKIQWYESTPQETKMESLKTGVTTNLHLQSLKSSIEAAKGEFSIAKKTRYPELSLNLAGFKESGGAQEIYNKISFGFTIPIGGLIGFNIQSAQMRINEAEANQRLAQEETQSELSRTILRLNEARRRMDRYPLALRKNLERELSQTEAEFKRGLIETLLFLELENQTHEQIKNIYSAQNDFMRETSYLNLITSQNTDSQNVK